MDSNNAIHNLIGENTMTKLNVTMPCSMCSVCLYSAYNEYSDSELVCSINCKPEESNYCSCCITNSIIKDKISKLLNSLYRITNGKANTSILIIGSAIVGYINNKYWDKEFIPIYCEFVISEHWNDISDKDFLASEMSVLDRYIRKSIQ